MVEAEEEPIIENVGIYNRLSYDFSFVYSITRCYTFCITNVTGTQKYPFASF